MGLLDSDFFNAPDAQLGLSLLSAGGPSTVPMSFGQRLAGAVQGFQAQRDQSEDRKMRRQVWQSQAEENAAQAAARNLAVQRDQTLNRFLASRLPGAAMGPTAAPMSGVGSIAVGGSLLPPAAGAGSGQPGAAVASSSGGSAFPFSLDDITQLQALGYKGADGLFNLYKYANDGIKREAGNYYRDPSTGQERYYPRVGEGQAVGPDGRVSAAPGYAESNAAIKGLESHAQEAAKFPYAVATDRSRQQTQASLDVMKVTGEDGNDYYVPRSLVAGMSGAGGQGPKAAAGSSSTGGFMASRNPITQQSAIALNDNWIKSTYQPHIDAGRTASDVSANIQALRNIDIRTGWGTEAKASAASVLEGLGLSAGNAGMYAANAQKFQSVAMDKLLTTLAAQKGMQTEGDADRARQTFVSLKNTPEANAFILDFAQAKANMDQRRAQYYEAALPLAQKSGDLTRIDREWRKIQGSIWADPTLQRWAK